MTNPYEATLANTTHRVLAWLRGLTRRYKKGLFLVGAAIGTLAVAVSAGQAPAHEPDSSGLRTIEITTTGPAAPAAKG